MRATGQIRRLDDLGRIVIPKSVRDALNIENTYIGKPYEIFYTDEGEIILKPVKLDEHEV